ncbi:unnamed protein product [Caenorhabditis sp. 36 PRJEB53466]|nr:unnamed protein product [Caenorhabditis sp. 36 PRJEB53466]
MFAHRRCEMTGMNRYSGKSKAHFPIGFCKPRAFTDNPKNDPPQSDYQNPKKIQNRIEFFGQNLERFAKILKSVFPLCSSFHLSCPLLPCLPFSLSLSLAPLSPITFITKNSKKIKKLAKLSRFRISIKFWLNEAKTKIDASLEMALKLPFSLYGTEVGYKTSILEKDCPKLKHINDSIKKIRFMCGPTDRLMLPEYSDHSNNQKIT